MKFLQAITENRIASLLKQLLYMCSYKDLLSVKLYEAYLKNSFSQSSAQGIRDGDVVKCCPSNK